MLKDLSDTILDITYNSIRANAKNIEVLIEDSLSKDYIKITIIDDGKGMSEETIKAVTDPFYTSRTTRSVGLGVPFFKSLADELEGEFFINSLENVGTTISTKMRKSLIDTPPFGDLVKSFITLMLADESINFIFSYLSDTKEVKINTKDISSILDGVSYAEPSIYTWLTEYFYQEFGFINKV